MKDGIPTPNEKIKYVVDAKTVTSFGGCDDPSELLVLGETYEVASLDIRSWHTKVTLVGFPNHRFNSAIFEEIDE